jgi:hypothetical protein
MNKRKIRRAVTVNDLLARDDVNGILADLDKEKPNIQDLVVVYIDRRDNRYYAKWTEATLVSTAVWMLESTKLDLLNANCEED